VIDINLLRESPEQIGGLLVQKEPTFDVQLLLSLDGQVRAVRARVEALRHEKNELAKQARGGVTDAIRTRSIHVGTALKEQESMLEDVQKQYHELLLHCPNIPMGDVPSGNKESNKVIKVVGSKPTFSFPIKNHVALGNALGWFDFEAATHITGSNFALYKGDAVKLLYSLTMLMLKNNIKHGFTPILPSVLVNEKSLEVASNFPKFREQVYAVGADGFYLTPTAEVNLANLYRDHIFKAEELPLRLTAWTSCFRREAGTYGATERGLIRIHQFEKVELYTLCTPHDSNQELERMVACASDILDQLGLHYRISLLAGQDCSFASAKTYDIEVWLPGQNAYYEVSSISNCTDFQARRGLIRYKEQQAGKTHLVHTLNGSSLALPRLMVALMEVYQQADGTIALPKVLKNEGFFI